MSAPQWSQSEDETYDLLSAVAVPHPAIGADVPDLFLDACRRDAMAHDGVVSVNRVRALMAGADIPPRRYSALWAHFTGKDRPMYRALDINGSPMWEPCEGSTSGNDGRPFQLRRWVGAR